MILQALAKYYDILTSDSESGIAPLGYSSANVSYALTLTPEGSLVSILPLAVQVPRGHRMVETPRKMIVPEPLERTSGVDPNFLCDNCSYVLGISDKEVKDKQYANKRFEAFRKYNCELLAGVDCDEARAVTAFLQQHDPATAPEHPEIAKNLEGLFKGSNLVFRLEGSDGYVHEAELIRRAWEASKAKGESSIRLQCLVTGETAPVARLHPRIKGVQDANSTGAKLVGFNKAAYESYNRSGGQGLNSPTSEKATFAYTTALNYLLSRDNPNRSFVIGDATVVYWAESSDPGYGTVFYGLFGIEPPADEDQGDDTRIRDKRAEQRLSEVAKKVRSGSALDTSSIMAGLDPGTRFHVLGLAPNTTRLAVRFYYQDAFKDIVTRIMKHYQDMAIDPGNSDQARFIPIKQILDETVSKRAKKKTPQPLMAGAVMRAVLQDIPYPAALFNALMIRIRADVDDKEKHITRINYRRAAMLKAILTRKYRYHDNQSVKEVLCMSLNEEATHPAYLLGRLFAVLEKAQKEAISDLNAPIKDRYFTAACTTPATVFPVLLRLSQHYISKAKYGYVTDNQIEAILDRLDIERNPIPAHLTLDEQGIFVLGYYQQRAAFYKKKEAEESAEPSDTTTISKGE